jgi:hypothetical protein
MKRTDNRSQSPLREALSWVLVPVLPLVIVLVLLSRVSQSPPSTRNPCWTP